MQTNKMRGLQTKAGYYRGYFNLVSADEVESLAGGNANGRVQR